MSRFSMRWGVVVGVLSLAVAGCGSVAPTGDLDALTEDGNGNGFLDVTPPDGVEFLTVDNVNVRIQNTITTAQLGALAAQFGVDPALLNLVDIIADVDITLDYGDGITDSLVQSESIEPFDRRFEVACPEAVTVNVHVSAEIPLVGPQDLTDFNVELGAGVEYDCGQTIEVQVYVNESGSPDVAIDVQ